MDKWERVRSALAGAGWDQHHRFSGLGLWTHPTRNVAVMVDEGESRVAVAWHTPPATALRTTEWQWMRVADPGPRQALDLLAALGLLPAEESSLYAAGYAAGAEAGGRR